MAVDRPGPGEELHEGEPTVPRVAASVMVLREAPGGFEVLIVQRHPGQRFVGGCWVFPGGSVDPADGEGQAALRAAGRRETAEEAGVELPDADALIPFSRWITPAQVKIRFDTWFFLAEAPAGARPRVDGRECVDWRWSTPAAALAAREAGELEMIFPTIKHLEQLAGFPSAAAALDHARTQEIRSVEPRVVMEGETARILLPGEPGYD
jgi:8-oxo-dGTP pyrophosphatase MutT (NUDIX family)